MCRQQEGGRAAQCRPAALGGLASPSAPPALSPSFALEWKVNVIGHTEIIAVTTCCCKWTALGEEVSTQRKNFCEGLRQQQHPASKEEVFDNRAWKWTRRGNRSTWDAAFPCRASVLIGRQRCEIYTWNRDSIGSFLRVLKLQVKKATTTQWRCQERRIRSTLLLPQDGSVVDE